MFGNYIRSMPKISGADSKSSTRNSGSAQAAIPKHSKGGSGTGTATAGTRCQKCEKFGHFTYNCPSKNAPYKSRPTRTQQLINPKVKKDTPTVEVPQEFLSKKGLAAKILEQKEQERNTHKVGASSSKPQKTLNKKSSSSDSSTSTTSSSSDSSSDYDSSSDNGSDSDSHSGSSTTTSDASRPKHRGRAPRDDSRSPVRHRGSSRSPLSDSSRYNSRQRTTTAPTHSRHKRQLSRSRSPSQMDADEQERRKHIRAGKQREARRDER